MSRRLPTAVPDSSPQGTSTMEPDAEDRSTAGPARMIWRSVLKHHALLATAFAPRAEVEASKQDTYSVLEYRQAKLQTTSRAAKASQEARASRWQALRAAGTAITRLRYDQFSNVPCVD